MLFMTLNQRGSTFGIEQASSFLERNVSHAFSSQIRPPEKRAVEVVDKVLGDEKDAANQVAETRRKKTTSIGPFFVLSSSHYWSCHSL